VSDDPLQFLHQAKTRAAALLDQLQRDQRELIRLANPAHAPGQAALARAIDSAAQLLRHIDDALAKSR
jgi:hypothetical protein